MTLDSTTSGVGTHKPLEPGISTCIVRPQVFSPSLHLPMIAEAGFKVIELNCNNGHRDVPWDDTRAVRELRSCAASLGMRIASIHALGDTLPLPDSRETRRVLATICAMGELAVELGAEVLPFHAGLPAGLPRDEGLAMLEESLSELAAHARGLPIAYGWENEARGLTSAEHMEILGSYRHDELCFVLDNGHANMHGDAREYLRSCGTRLRSLHLNDNDGDRDLHQVPGEGTFGWTGFRTELLETGYLGPLMLEVESYRQPHRTLAESLAIAYGSLAALA